MFGTIIVIPAEPMLIAGGLWVMFKVSDCWAEDSDLIAKGIIVIIRFFVSGIKVIAVYILIILSSTFLPKNKAFSQIDISV